MAERMSGEDAVFLRFERPDTPTHTLKIVVLDPARRGAPITVEDLAKVLPAHLGLQRRSTMKLGRLPGSRAWAWVQDDAFDIANHLGELTVPMPGGRAELDRACAQVLVRQLDRRHPLWHATLVHGLAGGRQAVILRIHHAISDGMASINLLRAATTVEPHGPREVPDETGSVPLVASGSAFKRLRRARSEHRKRVQEFGTDVDLPALTRRTAFNPRTGTERLCASTSLDLAELQEIARLAGVSLNGAFHGIVAGAMRRELMARDFPVDRRLVAAFGVADGIDVGRRHGNRFATSFAYLHADVADPVARLHAAAQNSADAVGLRRATGFEYYRAAVEYQQHIVPRLRAWFAQITPIVGNQITLANVPGPAERRWLGEVEIVDWISHSIAIAPSVVSLTGHSYAGRLSLGLTVAPQAVPDPEGFLRRFQESVDELLRVLRTRESRPPQGS